VLAAVPVCEAFTISEADEDGVAGAVNEEVGVPAGVWVAAGVRDAVAALEGVFVAVFVAVTVADGVGVAVEGTPVSGHTS
jgi:hypothetical protein